MVTGLELAVLAGALVLVLGVARIIQAVRPLLVNTVVGLTVFFVASLFDIQVAITWVAVAVVAVGGLPGALAVILLALLEVAFVPAAMLMPI